jgi:hypothetical protein
VRAAQLALVLVCALFLPAPGFSAQGDCAQPASNGAVPSVSDCLFILRTAVGITTCDPACICAPKGTLPTSASDALLCLRKAVGQDVTLNCPCDGGTTSTTHTTVTTGITNTTSTTGGITTTTLIENIETKTFEHACVSVTLRPNASFTSKVKGEAAITVEVNHSSIGDRDHDGLEEVEVEITSFLLTKNVPLIGTVTVSLPDPDIDVGQERRTLGLMEETFNTTPGVLNILPYGGSGTAAVALDLFIQASLNGTTRLHHHEAVGLAGIFSSFPPAAIEGLQMQNTSNIPVLKDDETQYGTTVIDTQDKATIDLTASSCE